MIIKNDYTWSLKSLKTWQSGQVINFASSGSAWLLFSCKCISVNKIWRLFKFAKKMIQNAGNGHTLNCNILFQHRLPSDPNEVVSRLQSRLNMMASADTVSLCSDKDGGNNHSYQVTFSQNFLRSYLTMLKIISRFVTLLSLYQKSCKNSSPNSVIAAKFCGNWRGCRFQQIKFCIICPSLHKICILLRSPLKSTGSRTHILNNGWAIRWPLSRIRHSPATRISSAAGQTRGSRSTSLQRQEKLDPENVAILAVHWTRPYKSRTTRIT